MWFLWCWHNFSFGKVRHLEKRIDWLVEECKRQVDKNNKLAWEITELECQIMQKCWCKFDKENCGYHAPFGKIYINSYKEKYEQQSEDKLNPKWVKLDQ